MASTSSTWKQRFRAPSIYFAEIAQNAPERGLVYTNLPGTRQFYTLDVPHRTLNQLTFTPGGHTSFIQLSPDGRWCYYLKDRQGNEIGHYVRIPYEGGEPVDITPEMPPYPSMGFSQSRDGAQIGFSVASPDGFAAYLMEARADGSFGAPRKLYECSTISFGPLLSADHKLAVVMSSEHSGKNEFSVIAFDAETGERLAELWDGAGTSAFANRPSPLPGDQRVVGTSNRTGFERLLVWNPITGERRDLDLGVPGSHFVQDWSPDGKTLIASALYQAVQSIYTVDLESGAVKKLDTPAGNLSASYYPDGSGMYALWNDASHNTRLIDLDPATGAMTGTVLEVGQVPPGQPMRSVSFPSSDGQMIQGWLMTPAGKTGPFPTILETHGGPTAVQSNGFHPTGQAWVDQGYAFLSINYRGSTTFGREFEHKIWNDLGHWEVEDMTAARDWLVKERIADPQAIFLTGWSYGGYLTLLALGKRPDLWAGGMAGIAIADWAVQWEDTADTLRGYQEALFGGTPKDQPERYAKASPITYAEAVQAPVLIIQGRNDTRTPARPVENYEKKMKALGKNIRVHWYDTGHAGGFADVEQGIRFLEMQLDFAGKIYQDLVEKRESSR